MVALCARGTSCYACGNFGSGRLRPSVTRVSSAGRHRGQDCRPRTGRRSCKDPKGKPRTAVRGDAGADGAGAVAVPEMPAQQVRRRPTRMARAHPGPTPTARTQRRAPPRHGRTSHAPANHTVANHMAASGGIGAARGHGVCATMSPSMPRWILAPTIADCWSHSRPVTISAWSTRFRASFVSVRGFRAQGCCPTAP